MECGEVVESRMEDVQVGDLAFDAKEGKAEKGMKIGQKEFSQGSTEACRCSNHFCTSSVEGAQFHRIKKGCDSGGKNWSQWLGKYLCDACFRQVENTGMLEVESHLSREAEEDRTGAQMLGTNDITPSRSSSLQAHLQAAPLQMNIGCVVASQDIELDVSQMKSMDADNTAVLPVSDAFLQMGKHSLVKLSVLLSEGKASEQVIALAQSVHAHEHSGVGCGATLVQAYIAPQQRTSVQGLLCGHMNGDVSSHSNGQLLGSMTLQHKSQIASSHAVVFSDAVPIYSVSQNKNEAEIDRHSVAGMLCAGNNGGVQDSNRHTVTAMLYCGTDTDQRIGSDSTNRHKTFAGMLCHNGQMIMGNEHVMHTLTVGGGGQVQTIQQGDFFLGGGGASLPSTNVQVGLYPTGGLQSSTSYGHSGSDNGNADSDSNKDQRKKYPRVRVPGRCTYEMCSHPDESCQFHTVQEGCKAGNKDWAPVVGMVLCHNCYAFYCRHGTLTRYRKKPSEVIQKKRTEAGQEWRKCTYKNCTHPTESTGFFKIKQGCQAGGQDWTSVVGMVLCHACRTAYLRNGTLERIERARCGGRAITPPPDEKAYKSVLVSKKRKASEPIDGDGVQSLGKEHSWEDRDSQWDDSVAPKNTHSETSDHAASSAEEGVIDVLREMQKRNKEEKKACFYEQCSNPTGSNQFYTIKEGNKAGGQNWASLVGKTLCQNCYVAYSKNGTLERARKGRHKELQPEERRCAYEHCSNPEESSQFILVKEGCTAGQQDWSEVVGKVLCLNCYHAFRKNGTLKRQRLAV